MIETFIVKDFNLILEETWEKINSSYSQFFSTFRVIPILVKTSLIKIFEELNLPKEKRIMTPDELKTFFLTFSKEFLKDSPILGISTRPHKLWKKIKNASYKTKIPVRAIFLLPIPYEKIIIHICETDGKEEKEDLIFVEVWDVKEKEKRR